MNERLKRLIKKIGRILVLPTVLLLGYLLYIYSNIFVFSKVNIISLGNSKLEYIMNEQITDLESIRSQHRYFEIDLNKVTKDVENVSTFVDLAYVSKEFPNILNVYIKEKIPFVTLEVDKKRCLLLDSKAFVLDIAENDCNEFTQTYSTIIVKSDDPKISFIKDTQSSYFQLNQISDVLKVLNEYKVPVVMITLNNNVATFETTKKKVYIFSFNQDLDVQLSRFVAVINELERKGFKFKQIDLRFKRPVLSTR